MTDWEVPGYDVGQLLGFGGLGEVWSARERSSGARVALRRLPGVEREALAAVRATATLVRSLPSPHLVRVRATRRSGLDDVLVLDLAEGGPLAAVVARRGGLEPGQVVTAVAPLAEALGQAHAHGLVHGRLGLADVLVTAAGMPLLDGLGLGNLRDPDDGLDPTGALGPAADVWALGELCRRLLAGPDGELPATTPLPLRAAVLGALDPDPAARPTAADLAAALLAACPALPLPVEPVAPPLPSPPARRLPEAPRRLLAPLGGAVTLLLVVGAGWAWGQHADRPAVLAAAPPVLAGPAPVAAPDWRAVVDGLDAAREAALASADPQRLAAVYAPGSPLLAADRATVEALHRGRRTAVGVRHEVRAVRVLEVSARRVELAVTEALRAYAVLGDGRVVARTTPTRPSVVRMVLVLAAGGWRVDTVTT